MRLMSDRMARIWLWRRLQGLWCLIVGHNAQELLWNERLGGNTHMCERCLKFWRQIVNSKS